MESKVIAAFREHSGQIILLSLATIIVYSPAWDHHFLYLWDDKTYVAVNMIIRDISWQNIAAAFTTTFLGNYAPVHILSYMVDHAAWGLDPTGYHIENILLHAINGCLLYSLLIRLELPRKTAFLAAALFLLHPVQVESVAWVAQRKTLLAMIFFLTGWHCYLTYRRRETGGAGWYILSLVSLGLALLSKSIAIIFPLLILLQDLCIKDEHSRKRRIVAKLFYLFTAVTISIVAIISQAPEAGGGRRDYPGGSLLTTVYTMLPVVVSYLGDCFWPTKLLPFYMIKTREAADLSVFFAAAICSGLVAIGVMLWRTNRRIFFFFVIFFVGLAPVSQIIPLVTLKNDRYLYFPMIGFAALMSEIAHMAYLKYSRWRALVISIVLVTIAALSTLTVRQVAHWQDDVSLWSYTVQVDPENLAGWDMLTQAYILRGEVEPAFRASEEYHRLKRRMGSVRGFVD